LSLDDPFNDEDDSSLTERLADHSSPPPCEEVCAQDEVTQRRDAVHEALALLTERERLAVSLRFGLGMEALASYEQIGQRMGGICKERVRQLLMSAFEKLQQVPVLQALCCEG
jgi:RNA polymerase sigma factor (sigma-70 family)